MEKKIKKIQRKIEKKRMHFEKKCIKWLSTYMVEMRGIVDGLSCEEYTSSAGQTLEQIAHEITCAESYATYMIRCMLNAETVKKDCESV